MGYGHLGDSNLHLNITSPKYDDDVSSSILREGLNNMRNTIPNMCAILQILAQIEPFVYEWTSKHRGSISAEHGIGLMKANKIYYSKSPEAVSVHFLQLEWIFIFVIEEMGNIKEFWWNY